MMVSRRSALFLAGWLALASQHAGAQMFEIPAEMMGGMFGGGGGRKRRPDTQWPKSENSEIEEQYEWIVNTEWKGKSAKYLFRRDGHIESELKECADEGQCIWAANSGKLLLNTPTLKVVKFKIEGMDKVDMKKLRNKDESELNKVTLVAEKAGKSGKKSELTFERVDKGDDDDESHIVKDLYKILELPEDTPQSDVKSKYRRLSVQHHPDKGGDPERFNDIREAYEVLGDQDNRRYYDLGGAQLVKNIEMAWKEVEGQLAQLDAQLNQVPKNHPQRKMFEQQIEQQKKQFDKTTQKSEIEKKMRGDDIEVMVPVSAEELYNGVTSKKFEWKQLVICRGCRVDPDAEECKDCGRCPPEKIQVPKYANTPFGKQVVAVDEKERESRERCKEKVVPITNLKIPRGAEQGKTIKYVSDVGHQTPGKIPGKVVLRVQRGSPDDLYAIAESELFTVMHISLEQALFGFSLSWTHLGDETLTITRDTPTPPDTVVKMRKKGLAGDGGVRGDLYVRLAVDLPKVADEKSLTLSAPPTAEGVAKLTRESPVELREGSAWRRWDQRDSAATMKKDKAEKSEL